MKLSIYRRYEFHTFYLLDTIILKRVPCSWNWKRAYTETPLSTSSTVSSAFSFSYLRSRTRASFWGGLRLAQHTCLRHRLYFAIYLYIYSILLRYRHMMFPLSRGKMAVLLSLFSLLYCTLLSIRIGRIHGHICVFAFLYICKSAEWNRKLRSFIFNVQVTPRRFLIGIGPG